MASNEAKTLMLTVKVQLADIIQYAAGASWLIIEGERVFQANRLLLVGVRTVHEDGVTIFATCLKSSSPRSEPHKISIRTRPVFEQWTLQCSCEAGMVKCKHIMAVLNHLLMFPSVPLLTAADLRQKWGEITEKVAVDMHRPTLLTAFCKKTTNAEDMAKVVSPILLPAPPAGLTPDESNTILQLFVEGFPESSLAFEKNGRPKERSTLVHGEGVEVMECSNQYLKKNDNIYI
ncbi:uncharacterized protein LOC129768978 [Toxorhynchites rutilus septentrionalis]|uniref:uncharacterized protein LOC129768978 n=1 Tax=Toxorhynchites rutilus septentrionalis TaxID=329112 RepID=UPI002478A604|nr:uncharacterized protein LOC129768978 [Toxorhynchites rutilus septentrionalis]